MRSSIPHRVDMTAVRRVAGHLTAALGALILIAGAGSSPAAAANLTNRWADNDLTVIGPGVTDSPAIVTTSLPGEPTTVRALYRAPDNHVHELSYTTDRSWADNDLTAIGGGPGATASPTIVTTNIAGEPTVVRALYRGTDNHIHELSYISSRSWADNDLTTIGHGPAAADTPTITTTNITGEPTVVRALYRGTDNHIHELSYISSRSWADNDLTAIGGGPGATESPSIVTTNIAGEPTVVRALYRGTDNHLHELSYTLR